MASQRASLCGSSYYRLPSVRPSERGRLADSPAGRSLETCCWRHCCLQSLSLSLRLSLSSLVPLATAALAVAVRSATSWRQVVSASEQSGRPVATANEAPIVRNSSVALVRRPLVLLLGVFIWFARACSPAETKCVNVAPARAPLVARNKRLSQLHRPL